MSLAQTASSAFLKLAALVAIVTVFFISLASVVYLSLQGKEIQVPDVAGKNFTETEKELAALGLKVKKRAERVSAEPVDAVVEQLPKAGETVKTGQMIYVVTSKGGGNPADVPATVKSDEDDREKIEEMISDKPRKAKSNSNTAKKKADTTRDGGVNSNSNSDSSGSEPASNKKDPGSNTSTSTPTNKQTTPASKPGDKPKPGTDQRGRPGTKTP